MDRSYEKYLDYSDEECNDGYDGGSAVYCSSRGSEAEYPAVRIVLLDKSDSDYLEVSQLFQRTGSTKKFCLALKGIEKVTNPVLLMKFEEKKKDYEQMYGHVRVVKVFHGTKNINIPSILENNLQVQRHGQSVGHRFGAGVSFSAFSNYASHYCDESQSGDQMLLCDVIVSNMIEVPELKRKGQVLEKPPYIPGRYPLRYDTTAKNKSMNVIVKFENHTFYPAYIIHFVKTHKSSQPCPSLSVDTVDCHFQDYEREVSLPFTKISVDLPALAVVPGLRPDPTPIWSPPPRIPTKSEGIPYKYPSVPAPLVVPRHQECNASKQIPQPTSVVVPKLPPQWTSKPASVVVPIRAPKQIAKPIPPQVVSRSHSSFMPSELLRDRNQEPSMSTVQPYIHWQSPTLRHTLIPPRNVSVAEWLQHSVPVQHGVPSPSEEPTIWSRIKRSLRYFFLTVCCCVGEKK